jgi:sterol desaturase/sphingolipid hydroxylase (fatty acid hydroxylase superfamily)
MKFDLLWPIGALALLAAVYWPLERAFPARAGQPWLRRALTTDTAFFFGQYLLWSGLALLLLRWLDGHLGAWVPLALRSSFASLPFVARALVVVLLGDLSVYGFHRACHRFEWMWRIHAIHHSSEHLDWLAAHREHPLDGIGTQLSINLPAMILGFSVNELAWLATLRGMWAILIHSNVRLPLGPLKWLLGAPEFHHWHHRKHGAVQNFGNVAPWCDWLFGTHFQPEPGDETWEVGLVEPLPKSYLGLLLWPFRSRGSGSMSSASTSASAPSEAIAVAR